jgi:hypothetical protein
MFVKAKADPKKSGRIPGINRSSWILFPSFCGCLLLFTSAALAQTTEAVSPIVSIEEAPELPMPGAHEFDVDWGVDGNSPANRGPDGALIIFNSFQFPWRSEGSGLTQMNLSERVTINNRDAIQGGLWLEATYRDRSGALFGWVHNETNAGCEGSSLAIPRIRQMISYDDGKTWDDQGVVLSSATDSVNCQTGNSYFASGEGDFSVIFDPGSQCFYFYFTSYNPEVAEQGLGVARLSYQDLMTPVGNVQKWFQGDWSEPGVGGRITPIMPPTVDWNQSDLNAYWGPAIHYNTYLQQYVMLLNHAIDANWGSEGYYVSFNPNPADPNGWTAPQRLPLDPESPAQAYPQVIGLEPDGDDKTAGQIARFFLEGVSKWQIVFNLPLQTPSREPRDPASPREEPARATRSPT